MDQAEITMLENLKKNSGKTLEEWIKIVTEENLLKHGEILKFLKEQHSFTHGFANLVALKTLKTDSGSAENKDELIEKQYVGKEHLRPIYNRLINEIMQFGEEFEIAPKISYVSLRRKKQFAILQAATKSRFEIGLNIKGQKEEGILEVVKGTNSMCSHKIKIESENEINDELINWIRIAFNNSK